MSQESSNVGPNLRLNKLAYLSSPAQLFGKITVGSQSSIWPNVVMRAEVHEIRIGQRTNIQDFVMVHVGERKRLFEGTALPRQYALKHTETLENGVTHQCFRPV